MLSESMSLVGHRVASHNLDSACPGKTNKTILDFVRDASLIFCNLMDHPLSLAQCMSSIHMQQHVPLSFCSLA
jgi:hypothetical protein